jgi:vacuolar-type H+-ATPase subunit E/Vma4
LVPAACLVVLLVVQYWQSSAVRRVQRVCEAAEAKAREDSAALRDGVRDMTTRWQRDIKSREQSIQKIFDKNAQMTKTIDGLAAALSSCAPRAFSAQAAV